jgi:hypothetical protein
MQGMPPLEKDFFRSRALPPEPIGNVAVALDADGRTPLLVPAGVGCERAFPAGALLRVFA